MKYRINGIHVAYISDDLLTVYKRIMNISNEEKDGKIIRDIVSNLIFEEKFSPDEAEIRIKMLVDMAEYHNFKNVGEFIEYKIHEQIEKKLELCKNCSMYMEGGYCAELNIRVSGNAKGCKKDNKALNDAALSFLEKSNKEV